MTQGTFKVVTALLKIKKTHTIGELLIKPCALEMVDLVFGLEQQKIIELFIPEFLICQLTFWNK